ncbi:MAG: guanylate kinase [Candidatus Marinimicrobia bacterium]|jgi:guanylate kinase|nr:guanylate kinase [Candidatus Neomarinimicrobiota bacterium]
MKLIFTISAPSGTGKSTLCKAILKEIPDLSFSVSYTTRPQRENEIDGVDYHFISHSEFQFMIDKGQLAEYEDVHGHFYGTLKTSLKDSMIKGNPLLLELDVKGAMAIKKLYPEQTLSIFVKPPNEDALRLRLENRGTDDKALIKKRLTRIHMELEYGKMFDVSLINDDLDTAIKELKHIILTELKGKIHEY